MPIFSSKAIILNTVKYGDNSLVVNTFTQEHGRLSFLVNGIHSKKSGKKAKLFQSLFMHHLVYDYQAKKNLQRIKEMALHMPFQSISDNIYKRTLSLFLAEVLTRVLKEEEKNESLFSFLENSIVLLDELPETAPNFHLAFLLQLSAFLGFFPNDKDISQANYFDFSEGVFTASKPFRSEYIEQPELQYFRVFVVEKMSDSMFVKIPKSSQQKLLELLLQYYRQHLGNFPAIRSLAVLQEVFG